MISLHLRRIGYHAPRQPNDRFTSGLDIRPRTRRTNGTDSGFLLITWGVAGSSPTPQLFRNQNSQCHVFLFNLLTFFFFFVQLVCRINQLSAAIVVFLQVASF